MSGIVPVKFSGKPIKVNETGQILASKEQFQGDEELLQSLVDLGYLNERQITGQKDRILENQYYLARSLRA